MIHLTPNKSQAITKLKKERGISTSFSCRNDEIFWHDSEGNIIPNPTNITDEQISEKLTQLQSEYDAQDYARKRKAEYPSIEELVVALYDTDDKADIEAKRAEVKVKYPKP